MLTKKESPEKVGSASVTSPPPQVALLHPISCQGLVPRFLGVRVEVGTGWGRERWCPHAFFSRVKGFLNA